MRSQTKRIRRPSAEELDSEFTEKLASDTRDDSGGLIQKASIEYVSFEERQKEAKKPIYLVRYE